MSSSGYMGPEDTHSGAEAEGGVVGRGSVGGDSKGKVDGLAKVTGAARYTADLRLPRMVHAKVLRSPHPHARIVSIDAGFRCAFDVRFANGPSYGVLSEDD